MDYLQLPFIRVEDSAFPNKKNLAQKSKYIDDKKNWKKNCLQKFHVLSK